MHKRIFSFIVVITLSFFLLNIIPLYAADFNLKNAFDGSLLGNVADKGGYKTETNASTVNTIIGTVIQAFLGILGVIFLILMIYAGYTWMTAHGDEQKVTKAKETITAAIIGLVIVIGAYALAFFVISKLTADTLQ